MVAEIRGDLLYVFMPPTDGADHFVDLVARLDRWRPPGCRVVVEGYAAPDPGCRPCTITPDPGVIEVNVAPTAGFAEQRAQLETLYEQARLPVCPPKSFDVDGTTPAPAAATTSPWAASPADSPLLRRPDLLVSMLTYWQRTRPCPTCSPAASSAPLAGAARVDEGRATRSTNWRSRSPRSPGSLRRRSDPWSLRKRRSVDRPRLRHLLTDITGKHAPRRVLHRQALQPGRPAAGWACWSCAVRDAAAPQMAMVQSLLVRSLVAWFWDEPLRAPLIRHGGNLHGRYLLPHFLIHDIADVAADLRAHGSNSRPAGWIRSPSSGSRGSGTAVFDGVESSCAARSSRGTPWGGVDRPAAPPATSTRRWNASRCG